MRRAETDVWQYALEIQQMYAAGLTNTDLRILVNRGLALHRVEYPNRSRLRRFRLAPNLGLTSNTCFIGSEAGLASGPAPPPAAAGCR